MRVYIHYEVTDQPWGGINSFLRAMKESLINKGLFEENPYKADIILIAASSAGVNKSIDYTDIKHFHNLRYKYFFRFGRKKHFPLIVHRLDGLRKFYAGKHEASDELQIKLSRLADHIIFQSRYSLSNFRDMGYHKNNFDIVYNGTNRSIFKFHKRSPRNPLRIISCSWSNNINKGFKTISEFSLMSNVEVSFVGNWNPQVPQNNVRIIAPVNSITLAEIYEQQDVFLHAAVNDPCPNVVIEAMACGLPIIYSTSGGTPEIANGYGVPLSSGDYEKILEEIRKNYHNIVDKLEADQYKFDINTVVDEYLKIFKKLLDQKQVY